MSRTCAHTLDRRRRIFVLVLLTALFVYPINRSWPHHAVFWLRQLGGKLGLITDSEAPCVLLAGIGTVLITIGTFTDAWHHPLDPTALMGMYQLSSYLPLDKHHMTDV